MPFSDYRTALVTGANTGMGAAVTEMFTKRGLTVYGVARNADKLGEVADRTGMIPLPVDITDTAALAEAVGGLEIDILVNNAGVSATGNILDAEEASVDAMVDVNLRAVLHLCRILLPGMVERDLGHVVNISSIAGLYNFYGHTAYHATKAAVHQISRQLRNDCIGKRIRVTEICPGRVETEIFGRNLGGTPEAMKEAWRPSTKATNPSLPRTSRIPSSSRSTPLATSILVSSRCSPPSRCPVASTSSVATTERAHHEFCTTGNDARSGGPCGR
ncbi:SDR family oxidoreductase [Rhodococcus sp. 1.20]